MRPYGILGDAFGHRDSPDLHYGVFLARAFVSANGDSSAHLSLAGLHVAACAVRPSRFVTASDAALVCAPQLSPIGLQLALAGMVYGIGLLWAFLTNHAFHVGNLVAEGLKKPAQLAAVEETVESFQQDI